MSTGPKIVHKQFNSPIGLYSQQNIQETLNKHLQNLDNGTVGIDFQNPVTDKPANLANSAVLRMLEEEERNRKGLPKLDQTQVQAILDNLVHARRRFDKLWPPEKPDSTRGWNGQVNATSYIYSELMKATKGTSIVEVDVALKRCNRDRVSDSTRTFTDQKYLKSSTMLSLSVDIEINVQMFNDLPLGQKKVVWPPVPETNGYHQPQQQSPAYYNNAQTPNQQYSPQPPVQQPVNRQAPQSQFSPSSYPSYQAQGQPAYCDGKRQEATGLSKLIPVGPGVTASPVSPYRQGPLSPSAQPYKQQPSRWAPVPAPVSPQPQYGSQPQYSPQPQYSEPVYQPPQRQFEPPPTTITLRQQPPVHQQPPPVFASQPATASLKGGVNMRGDQKWPPQSVKDAVDAENEARRQLAKGPACRPRKVKKDYTEFFSQHALNHSYTSYRVPPGTQHFEPLSGRSSY
ncbi:unnamed protein product [Danaus chrysippus]|uniref:(African queen) hypothetical protein n=1 Tax=Danaus chrysippus TaxID=151541 RepID=A0A8J2QCG6_9NEOP|nr:unnamed protein product [Danaus chrysippus]